MASPKPAAAQDPSAASRRPHRGRRKGQGQGGFGDFGDSSGFGANFNGAQPAPVDKKNDIMSMFNTQPQGQMGMGGMGGGMGGMGGACSKVMGGWRTEGAGMPQQVTVQTTTPAPAPARPPPFPLPPPPRPPDPRLTPRRLALAAPG